jgi:hypothetical protein
MEASDQRCTRCGRPFTPGEVTGFGFLRGRPQSRGGPLVEFRCPGCGTSLRLIPHGQSRYAFPGMPPPPAAPEAERAPPWVQGKAAADDAPADAAATEPEHAYAHADAPDDEAHAEPEADPIEEVDIPLTLEEARDVLGVSPEASEAELEEAFRKRSRTCHPDKVAHLDPEFQELAKRKFDLLRRAFERLHP